MVFQVVGLYIYYILNFVKLLRTPLVAASRGEGLCQTFLQKQLLVGSC